MGSVPIEVEKCCPNCGRNVFCIRSKDTFGIVKYLEAHCNQCYWSWDPEDNALRYPGFEVRVDGSISNLPRTKPYSSDEFDWIRFYNERVKEAEKNRHRKPEGSKFGRGKER